MEEKLFFAQDIYITWKNNQYYDISFIHPQKFKTFNFDWDNKLTKISTSNFSWYCDKNDNHVKTIRKGEYSVIQREGIALRDNTSFELPITEKELTVLRVHHDAESRTQYINFNLSQKVKVKITGNGKKYLYQRHKDIYKDLQPYPVIEEDMLGYSEWSLRSLFATFGEALYLNQVVEPNLFLINERTKE